MPERKPPEPNQGSPGDLDAIALTGAQRKELEDFRATLPGDLQEALDRMINAKGEKAIYGMLGHLRAQAEYIASL